MKNTIIRIRLYFMIGLFSLILSVNSSAQETAVKDSIARKKLLLINFPETKVGHIDIREITLKPLQQTGYHEHPIPVTGYIVSGTCLFQVEGEPSKILHTGDVYYEPANRPIKHFDNSSAKQPLKFISYYLTNHDEPLIIKLTPKMQK